MPEYLIVYADDREFDAKAIELANIERGAHIACLKTGVGKVRAATEVTSWLTGALRGSRPRPRIISVGTCASTIPGLLGQLVRPAVALDRDSTPALLTRAGVDPQPILELAHDHMDLETKFVIGTGDGFVANAEHARSLAAKGVQLVDMETHAVAWAALRCYAGRIYSLRYVTDEADPQAATEWQNRLEEARVTLTESVLRLTEGTGDA